MATISLGGREAPRGVLEAGRKPEGALLHALLDRAQHGLHLVGAQGPIRHPRRAFAERALAEQHRVVDRRPARVRRGRSSRPRRSSRPSMPVAAKARPALLGDRPGEGGGRAAAVAGQLRGDALAHAAVRGRIGQDVAVGVRVDVDEPRADVETASRPRRGPPGSARSPRWPRSGLPRFRDRPDRRARRCRRGWSRPSGPRRSAADRGDHARASRDAESHGPAPLEEAPTRHLLAHFEPPKAVVVSRRRATAEPPDLR